MPATPKTATRLKAASKASKRAEPVNLREVPVLSDAEKAFHRGVADAGERLSVAAVSASFLKRYGSSK